MTTPTSPVEMDYTNRDYDSIRTFLVSTARGYMPEWVTVGEPADFGTLLIELYAYVGDIMSYYIDRVAAEPFLASAVRRQSILGIAQMLGYNPITQQAATGVVLFSLTDTAQYTTTTLTIPKGTVVQTPASPTTGAISFETIGNAVLGNGVTTVSVGAQEGRTVPVEWLAISNGAPLQEYVLRYQGVIHRSLTLTVQETDQVADPTSTSPQALAQQWTFVDNLVDTDPDASVFTTYIDDQQFTHVVFGDNVAGRIPPTGSTIQVSYRYGAGAIGNVAPSQISIVSPPITFVAVTNVASFSGGADNESIDSMRHGIPRASKIKNRAITLADFSDLAFQVPGVGKATATGAFYTQVKVYIAPVGGGYPNTSLLNQVLTYLQDRTLVGTTIEMHPTDALDYIYTRVKVTIIVHVLPQYGQLTVVNAVTQAVQGVFSFDSPGIDFGSLVSRGDVYHAAINVTGVDWIELTQMVPLDDAGNPIGTSTIQDVQVGPTRIPTALITDLTITGQGGLT